MCCRVARMRFQVKIITTHCIHGILIYSEHVFFFLFFLFVLFCQVERTNVIDIIQEQHIADVSPLLCPFFFLFLPSSKTTPYKLNHFIKNCVRSYIYIFIWFEKSSGSNATDLIFFCVCVHLYVYICSLCNAIWNGIFH